MFAKQTKAAAAQQIPADLSVQADKKTNAIKKNGRIGSPAEETKINVCEKRTNRAPFRQILFAYFPAQSAIRAANNQRLGKMADSPCFFLR